MGKKLLADFTKEEYKQLRKEFGTDECITKHLFINLGTLARWKRANGVYARDLNMPIEDRAKIVNQMIKDGYTRDEIAEKVKLKNGNSLNWWISQVRKKGIVI